MKKLLIFDLDGTLADTLPSITRAINLAAAEFGYPESSDDDIQELFVVAECPRPKPMMMLR